jgi:uncharacterized protein YcnI
VLVFGVLAALMGLVALAPVASAEVSISPAQADQGGAAQLTLQVRNSRPGVFTTQVKASFPQETPIAEIYPMSVDNWAPLATSREVDEPLQGIHNSGLTTVTTAITWIRAEDAPKAPAVENLVLQLGPLPQLDELVLTIEQTYSDGKVETFSGPSASGNGTVLRLQPPAAAAAPAEEADPEAAAPAEDGNTGTQLGLIAAGIVVGLLVSALAVVTIGSRSRTKHAAEDVEEKEDVVA